MMPAITEEKTMTTTVKVQSHNYPVLVQVWDQRRDPEASLRDLTFLLADSRVLWPEHGEVSFYATTTRTITIVDLEYDDPRALASKPSPVPVAT
jgi:hypothetical protein